MEAVEPGGREALPFHPEERVGSAEFEKQKEDAERVLREEIPFSRSEDSFEYATAAFFTLNLKGRIQKANLSASEILDLPVHELVSQPLSRFIHPEDLPVYRQHRKRLHKPGELQTCNLRVVRNGRSPIWVQMSGMASFDPEGGPLYRMTLSEISEPRKAEERLPPQHASFQDRGPILDCLFENLEQGLAYFQILFDSLGKIEDLVFLEANPALAQMFGRGEFGGMRFSEVFPEIKERTPELFEMFDRVTDTSTPEKKEVFVSASDTWLAITAYSKDTECLMALFEDISAQKSYQEALSWANSEFSRTLKELHASEARYRAVVEDQTDLIARFQPVSGVCTFVNEAFCRFLGKNQKELFGRGWLPALFPEEAPMGILNAHRISADHPLDQEEHQVLDGSGKARWVHFVKRGIFDDHGQVMEVQWVGRDITEQKQAERKLTESLQRLNRYIEDSPLAVMEWDDDFHIIRWSGEAERVFGWTAEEAIGRRFEDLPWVPEEDRSRILQVAMDLYSGQRVDNPTRSRNIGKDGTMIHCEWYNTAVFDTTGKLISVLSQVLDVTDRKQAEEELRLSEERFRSLTEHSPDSIYVTSEDRFVYVNPSMVRLMGASGAEELIGRKWMERITPKFRDPVSERLRHPSESGQILTPMEQEFLALNGSRIPVESIFVPIRYDSREAYLFLVRDISARKCLEKERDKREAVNRQLQKSESLSRMAGAIVGHNNNHLQVVTSNLELAMSKLPSACREVSGFLQDAMQSAHRLSEVYSLLSTYLGKTNGARRPLDLSETCRKFLPLLQEAIPKHLIFEADFCAAGPRIMADENQIQQALSCLVSNAWESIVSLWGAIRLSVKSVHPAEMDFSNRFPADSIVNGRLYACMEVADSGKGVAVAEIEKLFDPFYSSKCHNRGMGLSAALGIAKAHEGFITVDSDPERGSRFRIYFPQLDAPAQEVQVPASDLSMAKRKSGGTVLLVEDEEPVRQVTSAILRHLGFKVLLAKNGEEAVEIFRDRTAEIRVVFSDINMPKMDGWEMLLAVRKIAPAMPVILASGYGREQAAKADFPEKPTAYLSKPYKRNDLRRALEIALPNPEEGGKKGSEKR